MNAIDESNDMPVSSVLLEIFAFILVVSWKLIKIALVVLVLIIMVLVGLSKPQKNGYC
jgi:hypothetical protein